MVLDIMLPYYGDVELMKIAVRSVLAQTDPRWRLTVVDDGTAPGVPEWFAELAHPQVRYQRNPRNLGVSGNFQRCLDLAEHDYLVMMGCDDVMLPNYVATVHGLLERYPDATIVQPGVEVIGSDGAPIRSLVDLAGPDVGGAHRGSPQPPCPWPAGSSGTAVPVVGTVNAAVCTASPCRKSRNSRYVPVDGAVAANSTCGPGAGATASSSSGCTCRYCRSPSRSATRWPNAPR